MDSAGRCRLRVLVDASPCRPGRASASCLPSSGPALGDGHLLPAEAVRPSARPTGPAQDLYAPTGSASQPWRVGAGASTCPPRKRAPARPRSEHRPVPEAPARPGSGPLPAPEASPCAPRKGAPAAPEAGPCPRSPSQRLPCSQPGKTAGWPPRRGTERGLGDLQDAGCTRCARSGSTVGREGCWRSGRDEEITSTLSHRGEGLCASVRSLTSYFLVQFIIFSLKKRFCILNAAFGS